MNKSEKFLIAGGILALGIACGAAGYFTPGLPLITTFSGLEQFPLDTEYAQGISPQSAGVTLNSLRSAIGSGVGAQGDNALIGGDFGTNPWQRGVSSSDITNTVTYQADRWWGVAGASGALDIGKETAAADIVSPFAASARIQRKSGNTDLTAVCTGQVLTSANSTRFQGSRVEFVFHALAGANFSAANGYITATIQYGTGSDQSAANFATAAWTGQATAATGTIPISTSWGRYSVVGTVPVTATQVGVQICFTPVGTAGTNDWFEFTGAQLDANPGAVALNSLAGTGTARSFYHLNSLQVLAQAEGYFWRLSEPASGAALPGTCEALTSSTNICNVPLPTQMRATVPTIAITTAGTFKVNIANTATTIATPTAGTCSSTGCGVTAANTNTAGQVEVLSGGGGTGKWDVSAEL